MLSQSIEFVHSAIGPMKFVLRQLTQLLDARRCIFAHQRQLTKLEIQVREALSIAQKLNIFQGGGHLDNPEQFFYSSPVAGAGTARSDKIFEPLALGVEISYLMGEGWPMVSGHDYGRQMSVT
jgi:hypothetical protein